MLSKSYSRSHSGGLTMIELMVTVAVLGILLATAAPSMSDFIQRQRVRQAAQEMATLMVYARSEATMRNRRVNMFFGATCYSVAEFGTLGICDCARAPVCSGNMIELKTTKVAADSGISFSAKDSMAVAMGNGSQVKALAFMVPSLRLEPIGAEIDVSGSRGYKVRVSLSPLGRPWLCSPNGSYGDLKRCDAQ